MTNGFLVGLIWFIVLGGVPALAVSMGHGFSPWFAGYLVINAVSAIFIGAAIRLARE